MRKESKGRNSSCEAGGLRPEYRFDYGKSRRNRFSGRIRERSVVVVLEPDVASVFKDSASVNELLRSVAKVMRPEKLPARKRTKAGSAE